jgi:hypothetical protein
MQNSLQNIQEILASGSVLETATGDNKMGRKSMYGKTHLVTESIGVQKRDSKQIKKIKQLVQLQAMSLS